MDINHYFSALSNFSIGSITLSNLLPALLVLAVCLLAKRMLMKLVDRAIDASRIDLSLRAFLRSAVNIGLLILTALIVADKLGIPVTSLIAALGVAGLAVSLAVPGHPLQHCGRHHASALETLCRWGLYRGRRNRPAPSGKSGWFTPSSPPSTTS